MQAQIAPPRIPRFVGGPLASTGFFPLPVLAPYPQKDCSLCVETKKRVWATRTGKTSFLRPCRLLTEPIDFRNFPFVIERWRDLSDEKAWVTAICKDTIPVVRSHSDPNQILEACKRSDKATPAPLTAFLKLLAENLFSRTAGNGSSSVVS